MAIAERKAEDNWLMGILELAIWSAMLGAMMVLAAFAAVDGLMRRSIASWRAFNFVLITGTACVLQTGLLPLLIPQLSAQLLQVLQNSLGLLSGALSLNYLGRWLGRTADDRLVRVSLVLGTLTMLIASAIMALLTFNREPAQWNDLLLITAVLNGLVMLPAAVAIARAIALGDRQAWSLLVAFGFLAVAMTGLYAHALHISGLGNGTRFFTSMATVTFFMVSTFAGLRRDRLNRRLERLAGLAQGDDPVTGLPKGSVLLSKVDDALWRSARMNQECSVICIHVRNLYELADVAGDSAERQILSALAARIRRAVGFRNFVGLYHPRCFVLVISTYSQTRVVDKAVQRLRYLLPMPLRIGGGDDNAYTFVPRIGIGRIPVDASNPDPTHLIEQAERLSMATTPDSGNTPSVNAHQDPIPGS